MMTVQTLYDGIRKHDKRALAKAITLIESTLATDREQAKNLLSLLSHTSTPKSVRIGISGIPGVGKSTFIETLGTHLLAKHPELRIAVLPIDPTSPLEGGSILADRIRMTHISNDPHVFIRPAPTQGTHGGLSRRTRETLFLIDAAGFDYIFVETVGVGQTEFHVTSLVDAFILLQMPATGDEWQALKKGILELADLIVINKTDGDLKAEALRLKKIYESSFSYTNNGTGPLVITCSAIEGHGIPEMWDKLTHFMSQQRESGNFALRRRQQNIFWFEEEIVNQFQEILRTNSVVAQALAPLRKEAAESDGLALILNSEKALHALLRKEFGRES